MTNNLSDVCKRGTACRTIRGGVGSVGLRPARVLVGCLLLPLLASGWDRQKAFDYLEARQQQWADWKPAQKPGGACISCHTGLSYLMARRALGEKQPHRPERDLVQGVRSRLLLNPPQTMPADAGVEALLNLFALASQRRGQNDPMDKAEEVAMERLWENQIQDGEAKGSWTWPMHDLHPAESEHSAYFGAALAEMALSAYPAQPADHIDALRSYLKREAAKGPLHDRMAWIAFRSTKDRESSAPVLRELWAAQSSDGGWSSAALGPWAKHETAPADSGSNAYATAWGAFTARESGVACSDAGLKRAMDWLERHQDPATGAWKAVSMNKVYPEGSMQSKFMTDTATGYAAAALIGCKRE